MSTMLNYSQTAFSLTFVPVVFPKAGGKINPNGPYTPTTLPCLFIYFHILVVITAQLKKPFHDRLLRFQNIIF